MGSWYLGEDPDGRDAQLSALRTGMEIGLTLIDTAEMYGDGAAEELVGRAIAGRRDDVFLVSKGAAAPRHAPGHGGRLRAEPAPTGHRPPGPVPAALARPGAGRGDRRRLRGAGLPRAHPCLGREQLRRPGARPAGGPSRQRPGADRPGALQPR